MSYRDVNIIILPNLKKYSDRTMVNLNTEYGENLSTETKDPPRNNVVFKRKFQTLPIVSVSLE